jgi:hypothetical protein
VTDLPNLLRSIIVPQAGSVFVPVIASNDMEDLDVRA